MTEVLLTHSNHLASDPKQLQRMQPYPPLGTLYAARALQVAGISVKVCDTTFDDPIETFRKALDHHRPKIVAIYEDDFNFVTKMCLTHMRDLAKKLAAMAGQRGITVVAHGSDATDHPDEYLSHGVDYLLRGEAEQILAELCKALLQKRNPTSIPGVVSRASEARGLPSRATSIQNSRWMGLPKAARELVDLEPYRAAWVERHGYFSTSVVASRGCPYRCNWCAKPISGDKFHIRDAQEVAAEICELRDNHGVQHIWFGDDVFALSRRWTEAFASAVEANGRALPFKIQSRADLMNDETVSALKRAGCAEVWMGVESGSQKILDAMDKGLSVETIATARARLGKSGIRACYFLQVGYPAEGWSEIGETIRLVRETRPDNIGVSVSYPLPGTVFFNRVQAQLGRKRNWKDSGDLCAIFTATYTDEFYQALRNALHAEVASWEIKPGSEQQYSLTEKLWKTVHRLEPISRNPDALCLTTEPLGERPVVAETALVQLAAGMGGA